jgi:regulator of sirC expression with transglutaminase-like and TPR domain
MSAARRLSSLHSYLIFDYRNYVVDIGHLLARQCDSWLNARSMQNDFSKDTAQQRIYRAFETLVANDDAAIDLLQGALLIASTAYPDLDMSRSLAQLDALARRVREVLALPEPQDPNTSPQLPPEMDHMTVLQAMNQVLFQEEHFQGNRTDYFNPDNSFFNRVLEKRTGIPITLSLLYIEVGKRVGIEIEGVALPYQFVVSCRLSTGNVIYIDPYEQGLQLSMAECEQRIRRMSHGRIQINRHWFKAVSHRHFLLRMLNNLKHLYIEQDDYAHALIICDLILLLVPQHAHEWRDRGTLHLQLKHYARAKHDLMMYLELAPQAEDRDEILDDIKTVRQMIARMN